MEKAQAAVVAVGLSNGKMGAEPNSATLAAPLLSPGPLSTPGSFSLMLKWRLHRLFAYAFAFGLMFSLVMVLDLHKQNMKGREALPVTAPPRPSHNTTAALNSTAALPTAVPAPGAHPAPPSSAPAPGAGEPPPPPPPPLPETDPNAVDSDTAKLFTQDELNAELQELLSDVDVWDQLDAHDGDFAPGDGEPGAGHDAAHDNAKDAHHPPANATGAGGDPHDASEEVRPPPEEQESLDDVYLRMKKEISLLHGKLSVEEYNSFLALSLQASRGNCDSQEQGSNIFKTNIEAEDSLDVEQGSPLWDMWCKHYDVSRPDAMRMFVSKAKALIEMIHDGQQESEE
mmetsp:Transcript_48188/g.118037  ORF Transcript_48188/g.118037 Transcript_48188/m.118037 type:complete len:342 (-) Transcript_48188:1208-2233(-)